jgi:all-trans-retinol 13,14-reductase
MVAVHALVPADRHAAIPHNEFLIQVEPSGDIRDLIYRQLRPSGRPRQLLLTLLTSGHDSQWQRWQHTRTGRRGDEYIRAKTDLAHELIGRIEKISGNLAGLEVLDVSTPLTTRDWVDSPNGSAYGVMHSTRQLLSAALLNRTSVKGLYLAGQSVLAPGILGTILGSFATVQFIVGPTRFKREVHL